MFVDTAKQPLTSTPHHNGKERARSTYYIGKAVNSKRILEKDIIAMDEIVVWYPVYWYLSFVFVVSNTIVAFALLMLCSLM